MADAAVSSRVSSKTIHLRARACVRAKVRAWMRWHVSGRGVAASQSQSNKMRSHLRDQKFALRNREALRPPDLPGISNMTSFLKTQGPQKILVARPRGWEAITSSEGGISLLTWMNCRSLLVFFETA